MWPNYRRSSLRSKADKKGIVIQYMRGYGYDGTVMDDTGSEELVDLKKENTFLYYFIIVLIHPDYRQPDYR